MKESSNHKSSLLAITLFGVLSVVFAEVFSGSAPLWFLDPWGIFVVLPLYWAHALLLLNFAVNYQRVSLSQLYLWGVIFGLYESWMTKVIWAGYLGETPQFGTFLGFATGEFMVIGLFWHAVFSFIFPILFFQLLTLREADSLGLLAGHEEYLTKTRRNRIILILIILIGSFFMPVGMDLDLGAVLIIVGGNVTIISVLYLISKRAGEVSLDSLLLGRRGLVITGLVLVILYVFLGVTLVPERFPGPLTILLTVLFYLVVLGLLHVSPRQETPITTKPERETILDWSWAWKLLLLFSVASPLVCLMGDLSVLIGTLLYLGMLIVGPMLFLFAVYRTLRKGLSHSSEG
ncbi:hypothetical protein EU546_01295 [Candidatus Thorarchaeota archaeon]|nr:MAG: hypothetical protein EU546_01295 [Candidatus Thorarchaeota archaeon]